MFARYLSTSENTLEKWEADAKHPSSKALKLLVIVRKHICLGYNSRMP